MTWVDNILLADDGSLFTVLPGGTLEIRGKGWTGPRRRKQPPGADNPRVCHLGDKATARRIAELVAKFSDSTTKLAQTSNYEKTQHRPT